MKHLLLILMTMAVFMSCGAKTKPAINVIVADSVAYSVQGKRMNDILFNPKSVNVYKLIGKDTIRKGDYVVEGAFIRDTMVCKLDSKQVAILQYILLASGENYKNDSVTVRSPYIPVLEFEFIKKKEIVHIIISLTDKTWTVLFDDKRQFSYNYSDKKLIDKYCNIFINMDKRKK